MNRIVRTLFLAVMALAAATLSSRPAAAQAQPTPIRPNPGFSATSIPANDDGSSPVVPIGFTINFFGRTRSSCFVNNNGNITLDGALATYTPFGLESTRKEIIAAFFSDVDTRGLGSSLVTYGQDTIDGRRAFGANYLNVGYYASHTDKLNRFQLVLIDRTDTGVGNFDIEFNYHHIFWETGDASGGVGGYGGVSAAVGWSNGSGQSGTSFELAGSLLPGSFIDIGGRALARRRLNSPVVGRYVFRARNGEISPPLTITIPSVLPIGFVGEPYSFRMTTIGGMEPQRWTLIPDPGVVLPGLTLSQGGLLSGMPNAPGTYSFTITVTSRTEDGDQTTTRRSELTVVATGATPVRNSCPLPGGAVGAAYRHTLTATGGTGPYSWSWGDGVASPVPGLALNESGEITGSPERDGTFLFTFRIVSGADSQALTTERPCSITIQPAPVATTVASCPSGRGTVGVPYAHTLGASGGTAPYRWSLEGQLPRGLSLDSLGRISGIPSVAGSYGYSLRVVDSRGRAAAQECNTDIGAPELEVTSACPLRGGFTGAFYSERLGVTGGAEPYGWSAVGTLPPGLTLQPEGLLSGRPTSPGPYHFRLVVSDREGRAAGQPCSLVVQRATLSISSCPLPVARLGEFYQRALAVAGGTPPFTWSLEGALPTGLSMTVAGLLKGTPAQPGSSSFTFRVADGRGQSASQACTLEVEPAPLRIESACPLAAARVGVAYRSELRAAGGIAPYVWSAVGTLPAGLELGLDGVLAGEATTAGEFPLTLQVTDSRGRRMTKSCSITSRIQELPTMRLTEPAAVLAPATSSAAVVLELGAAYPLPIQGELRLSVIAETANSLPEINQPDPNVRFSNGQTSFSFTIPAGARSLRVPLASSGTVAATVTVTVTRLRVAGTNVQVLPGSRSFRVERLAPVMTDACFRQAAPGLQVQITGYTTTRQLSRADLTGLGSSTTTVDVDIVAAEYFLTDLSVRTGGAFALTFPVTLAANATVPESLSVTLTNSVGTSASRQARRCQ